MNEFHTSKPNIDYYLKRNTPSFYQIKDYHFFDKTGRQYIIQVKDNQPLKNKKFQIPFSRETGGGANRRGGGKTAGQLKTINTPSEKPKECVVNNYNEITLYVKLANDSKWFLNSEIGRYIVIYDRRGKNPFRVKIKSTQKIDYKVKTGQITVQGLSTTFCNELLNNNEREKRKKNGNNVNDNDDDDDGEEPSWKFW